MKIEHLGVEVEYQESTNTWECEIRGRHRTFESLAKAKVGIEAEPKAKSGKVEKMEPIPVFQGGSWRNDYTPVKGVITSFAAPSITGGAITEAWCAFKGARSKERLESLYLDTPECRAVYESARELDVKAKTLNEEANSLRATIHPKAPGA